MSDNPKKPEEADPVEDLKKGLGLLFRAAKTAVEKLPTGKFEDVVLTGAREVGRAIENVTSTVEKTVLGKDKPVSSHPAAEAKKEEEPKKDEEPKKEGEAASGPRVG
jgi:hypothetical protein